MENSYGNSESRKTTGAIDLSQVDKIVNKFNKPVLPTNLIDLVVKSGDVLVGGKVFLSTKHARAIVKFTGFIDGYVEDPSSEHHAIRQEAMIEMCTLLRTMAQGVLSELEPEVEIRDILYDFGYKRSNL